MSRNVDRYRIFAQAQLRDLQQGSVYRLGSEADVRIGLKHPYLHVAEHLSGMNSYHLLALTNQSTTGGT